MKKGLRKKRTREHVLADLSVNYVEKQVLLCGFTAQRVAADYGIDIEITTYNSGGEIDEGTVHVQMKATETLTYRSNGSFAWRIERSDLVFWLAQPMPVILIVYEAATDSAYWLYVQSYFQSLKGFNLFTAGKSVTVNLSRTNCVDPGAIIRFGRFRDRVIGQIGKVLHDEYDD